MVIMLDEDLGMEYPLKICLLAGILCGSHAVTGYQLRRRTNRIDA